MASLFVFYVGGSAPGANIEVHDVQFAVADAPEDAYPELIARWYGTPESLHVDTCTRVTWVGGYDVTLAEEPAAGPEKLWFLNMGGYRRGLIPELHACGLFVAATAADAKAQAKRELLTGATLQHTDDQIDIDDCIQLAAVGGLHVHLTPNAAGNADDQPEFQGFLPIGR